MPTVNKLMLLGCAQSAPKRQGSFDGTTAVLTINAESSKDFPNIPTSGIAVLLTGEQVAWGISNITVGTTIHVEAQLQPLGRTAQGASVAYLVAQSIQIVAQQGAGSVTEISTPPASTPVQKFKAKLCQTCH